LARTDPAGPGHLAFHGFLASTLNIPHATLGFANRRFGFAFNLQTPVARRLSCGLFDTSFDLTGGSFCAISRAGFRGS
jgi:hypothetical protein